MWSHAHTSRQPEAVINLSILRMKGLWRRYEEDSFHALNFGVELHGKPGNSKMCECPPGLPVVLPVPSDGQTVSKQQVHSQQKEERRNLHQLLFEVPQPIQEGLCDAGSHGRALHEFGHTTVCMLSSASIYT